MMLTTQKKVSNFITKIFFIVVYGIFGTVVLNVLYNNSFWLVDNGNGGFVGNYINPRIICILF